MKINVFLETDPTSEVFNTWHYTIHENGGLIAHDAKYKTEELALKAARKRQQQLYEWGQFND